MDTILLIEILLNLHIYKTQQNRTYQNFLSIVMDVDLTTVIAHNYDSLFLRKSTLLTYRQRSTKAKIKNKRHFKG